VSLAELAADQRASTPSNAAELLTPDKTVILRLLRDERKELDELLLQLVAGRKEWLAHQHTELNRGLRSAYQIAQFRLQTARQLLVAYDPTVALQRGYAIVRQGATVVRSIEQLKIGETVQLTLSDGIATATITGKEEQYGKED